MTGTEAGRLARALTLKQMAFLVELADAGSFRGAARALSISQPALSAQIAKLEQTLGRPLALRGPHHFELTAAGAEVVATARAMLALVEDRLVPLATGGGARPLRVGVPNYLTFPIVLEQLSALRARIPDAAIAPVERASYALAEMLARGEIDAAYLAEPFPAVLPATLPRLRIQSLPLRLALPRTHPAAAHDPLRPGDLADLPILTVPRRVHPEHHDARLAVLREAGFEPVLRAVEAEGLRTHLMLAAAEGAGCIVTPVTRGLPAPLVARALPGDPVQHIGLAWRGETIAPALRRLVSIARRAGAGSAR